MVEKRIPRRGPKPHPEAPERRRAPPERRRRPVPMREPFQEKRLDDMQQDQINTMLDGFTKVATEIRGMKSDVYSLHGRIDELEHKQTAEIRDVKKSEKAFLTDEAIDKYESILARSFENIKILEKTDTKQDLGDLTAEFIESMRKNNHHKALKIAEEIIPRYDDLRENYINSLMEIRNYVNLLKDNYKRARDLKDFVDPLLSKTSEEIKEKMTKMLDDYKEEMAPDRELISSKEEDLKKQQEALGEQIKKNNETMKEIEEQIKKEWTENIGDLGDELLDVMKDELKKEIVRYLAEIKRTQAAREREDIEDLKKTYHEIKDQAEKEKSIRLKLERKLQQMEIGKEYPEPDEEEEEKPKKKIKGKPLNSHEDIKKTVGHYHDKEPEIDADEEKELVY